MVYTEEGLRSNLYNNSSSSNNNNNNSNNDDDDVISVLFSLFSKIFHNLQMSVPYLTVKFQKLNLSILFLLVSCNPCVAKGATQGLHETSMKSINKFNF